MTLRIFHTGDVHIGMKFNNYGPDVRGSLVEARFLVLENMINKSNELGADIFVVAGDLFNTTQIAKRDIQRTARILDKFSGACVLVLPGNHDYDNGIVDLWREFTRDLGEKVMLLNKEKTYDLKGYDLDAVVYGAPCHNKHSEENSLGWIKESGLSNNGKYHIGIGHGALEGLSPDIEGNYYSMTMEELNTLGLDLWLLGHTHVRYPLVEEIKDHKIYNAGTPEPDGLNYKHDGSAWFIELRNGEIHTRRILTGNYRFYDKEFILNSDDDFSKIKSWVEEGDPSRKIIRLSLSGSISKDFFENISSLYRELEAKVFHLIIVDTDLKIRVDKEIIEKEFTRGSFPHEFLTALGHDEEALQIAYDLLRRG